MRCYAVKHKDFDTRMASRSGGIFTALSDEILEKNGVIYGCALDDNFNAVHSRATTPEGRNKMRGSKYIPSDLGDTFHQVKEDLETGQEVLFSGLPCQVAGLRAYLKHDYDNLLCIDLVCHGVPSMKVWREYLAWQESKYGKCTGVDFRNKRDFGWKDHVETLWFGDKKIDSRVFTKIFYGHNALRPSCHVCPYKSLDRVGDISIADFWAIDKAHPEFNDNKGVSLVIVVTEKGSKAFENVMDELEYRETKISESTVPSMLKPYPAPPTREKFWQDFAEKPFKKIAKKYGRDSLKKRIKRKIKR